MIKKIVLQSIIYSTVFLFIFLFSFAFAQSSSNDNTLNCDPDQFLTIGSDGLECASIGSNDIQIGVSFSSLSAVCDNGIRELQVIDEDDEGLIKGIVPTCVVIPVCGVNEVLSYIETETETDTDTYAFQCINLDTFSGTFCPPNQVLTQFINGQPICQTFEVSRLPRPITPTTPDVCPPDPITNNKRIPRGFDEEGNPICEELPPKLCPAPGEVFSDTDNMCVPDCPGNKGFEWNISEGLCTCPSNKVYDNTYGVCIPTCSQGKKWSYRGSIGMCRCPFGEVLSDTYNRCVPDCPGGQWNISAGRCICPSGEVFSDSGNRCVPDCPGGQWNISAGRCTCPAGEVWISAANKCVSTTCSLNGQSFNPSTGLCTCPAGEVWISVANKCVSTTCPGTIGLVLNHSTGLCACPEGQAVGRGCYIQPAVTQGMNQRPERRSPTGPQTCRPTGSICRGGSSTVDPCSGTSLGPRNGQSCSDSDGMGGRS